MIEQFLRLDGLVAVVKGLGCNKCNNTGQLYPDSVQSLVAHPFLIASDSSEDLFHGMGREDIDAAMLGNGRPFVLELRMPKKRDLDLVNLMMTVNSINENRIKISNLKMVDDLGLQNLRIQFVTKHTELTSRYLQT